MVNLTPPLFFSSSRKGCAVFMFSVPSASSISRGFENALPSRLEALQAFGKVSTFGKGSFMPHQRGFTGMRGCEENVKKSAISSKIRDT
jgi:hypothetical protein